jgi:hypothetical protein
VISDLVTYQHSLQLEEAQELVKYSRITLIKYAEAATTTTAFRSHSNVSAIDHVLPFDTFDFFGAFHSQSRIAV